MSQVTEQSVRFQTALASIKLIQASAVLDLTEDDFDFLTRDRKSGSAGMPRPISYAVFCLKKKRRIRLARDLRAHEHTHDFGQVHDRRACRHHDAVGRSHENR